MSGSPELWVAEKQKGMTKKGQEKKKEKKGLQGKFCAMAHLSDCPSITPPCLSVRSLDPACVRACCQCRPRRHIFSSRPQVWDVLFQMLII